MTRHEGEGLRLYNWNLWFGGTRMKDGPRRQAEILREQQADIVFLQECVGDAADRLATAMGLAHAQQGHDTAILASSPLHPLATDTEPYATAALAETRLGSLLVWSVHLDHTDYGPYRGPALPSARAEVLELPGEGRRDAQSRTILSETDRLRAEIGDIPVIIAGDFNVPSPADWNGVHRPLVEWPATARLIEAGYVDAFRHIHPDSGVAPGLTWSYLESPATEPRDRIDFIYVSGLEVVNADHHGSTPPGVDPGDGLSHHEGVCRLIPDHADNSFPSDHLAVRATVHPPH
ncbi:hypothetical protein BHE97_00335 [Aeromicrobium sp. PE09-221]|uniref:endonuclease/exonuclease/phosphatase family protein n=1 Tax=Aeromicrobium sp. PE09-221 TaxID=1898043 RepID=UPI000B6B6E4D|nr:endonuclease/exonuclease/phosphatase family protein [Aeromicrobium sp. PE09-221]OUZ12850.1 hypothetical protein BHE97_00335 [Aeromicrobium sp. PE09-221]